MNNICIITDEIKFMAQEMKINNCYMPNMTDVYTATAILRVCHPTATPFTFI